jgi:hypothetical protein
MTKYISTKDEILNNRKCKIGEILDEWYDEFGNIDINGCYDAGGHPDGERCACAAEYYNDSMEDR